MRRRDYRPNKQRPREQSYRWAESLDRSSLIKSAEVTHGRGQFLQKNLNAALRVQRTLEAKITVLQSERAAVKAEYQRTHPLRTLVVTKLTGKSKGVDNNLQEQIRKIQLKKYKFEGKEFSISELINHLRSHLHSNSVSLSKIDGDLKATESWEKEKETIRAAEVREVEKARKVKEKGERARRQAALAAERLEKQRKLAEIIKRKLRRDHPCPYCSSSLGSNPHADTPFQWGFICRRKYDFCLPTLQY